MTTKEEEPKEVPNKEENAGNQEEEEKEEEEEPVDLELQKEMKGIKIDDLDFTNEPKGKKPYKKQKNPEDKKAKKKGQDFLDYANKNNIQINIEYEENKYQLKKKEDQKSGNKFNDNKKPYNKGGYKNDKNRQQKKGPNFSGNKFDSFGQTPPHQNFHPHPPKLNDNKDILKYLENLFSEDSLNKNTFIRNRLKDDKILVDEIAKYNDIKRNNINSQKIIEVIKDSQNLECINEDSKNYIKIKNFDKLKLLSLEQIIENNKAMRQKHQFMPMGGAQFYPPQYANYSTMQNNYFFNPYYNSPYPYPPVEANK